jgi:hypothetical protein
MLTATAMALGGCLSSTPEPARRTAAAVQVRLATREAQPPDAIVAADHDDRGILVATTRGERFVLRGDVQPASSEIRLLDAATLGQSVIARRRGGAFAFTLEHLRPGANGYVLEATHPARTPWRRAVRVVRRAPRVAVPRTVIVPREDVTPGEADLHLDRRRLVAVAIARDPGGVARVRVGAELRLRCRAASGTVADVPFVLYDPPAQIGEIRAVPGARVPGVLRRRSDVGAAARARCAEQGATLAGIRGVVWAEATNAHALDRYSADVPVGR